MLTWARVASMGLVLAACPAFAQQYKIAIIGLVHAHYSGYLPGMLRGTEVKLTGIAETAPDLIEEAKKMGAGAVPYYSDYRKMLDETKPDIVWAFVENNRHLEIARECAPRGIHLIYEKPLASTYKDALAIEALAKKHGIQVMCNYQMAWWPANIEARRLVETGAIGKPWRLRGIVGHGGPGSDGAGRHFFDWLTDPEKNGGGALVDFGCYNALWSLWYMGRPESVYAEVIHLRPERFPKVEDSSTMMLHYKTGINIFEGSWDLPRSFQDLEVFGSSAGPDGNLVRGSVYMTRTRLELRKGSAEATEVPLPTLRPEEADPIALMVNSLRTKKPVQGITAIDINVGVVEIIEAARESLRTGRAVKLPLAR